MLTASAFGFLPAGLTDGLKGKQTQAALDKLASSFAAVRGRVYGEFLVRTSKALTLIGGGNKLVRGQAPCESPLPSLTAASLFPGRQNALPESASATFNSCVPICSQFTREERLTAAVHCSRIDISQTPEQVMDIYTSALLPFAQQYNLSLVSWDASRLLYNGTEGAIIISVSGEEGLAPAPVTPLEGAAFDVFSWASQRVFGKGGREAEVVVSPSAATGSASSAALLFTLRATTDEHPDPLAWSRLCFVDTDTKHYVRSCRPSLSRRGALTQASDPSQWDLTRSIYRFVPRRVDTSLAAHTVDESILFKTHLETIDWYHELVLFADAIDSDAGF